MSSSRARTPTATASNNNRESPVPKMTLKEAKYGKPRVHLLDTCYICGNNFSSARQTIIHVRRIHGYGLPSRRQGHKRPQNKYMAYVRERNGQWDHEEIACPSCWFHCPEENLTDLNDHIHQVHVPNKVDPTKEDDGYASAASATSEASRRMRRRRSTSTGEEQSGGRIREGSAPPAVSDKSLREINTRLEDLTNIFKSFLNL